MNNAVNKLAAFTALAASFAGLMVSNSADASQLKIFGLSPDKTGTMKDGTKDVPYLVLAKTDDSTVTVMLHPNDASKLFKKGEAGTYKVIPADATEESTVPAEAQLQLQAELAAEQGVAPGAFETNPAPEPGSKVAKAAAKAEKAAAKLAAKEVKAAEKAAAKAAKVTAEPKEVKVTGASKAQIIFNEELANVKGDIDSKELRGKVVPRFKAELGMGAPGASTYYQNCKAKAKTASATLMIITDGATRDDEAAAAA